MDVKVYLRTWNEDNVHQLDSLVVTIPWTVLRDFVRYYGFGKPENNPNLVVVPPSAFYRRDRDARTLIRQDGE
jgi:hypothetical protein